MRQTRPDESGQAGLKNPACPVNGVCPVDGVWLTPGEGSTPSFGTDAKAVVHGLRLTLIEGWEAVCWDDARPGGTTESSSGGTSSVNKTSSAVGVIVFRVLCDAK